MRKILFNTANIKQQGYIAIISAIILCAVMVVMTTTISASELFTRLNVLDTEYKRISLGLAESCANSALLKIAQDYSYGGNEFITIQEGNNPQNCSIKSITYSPEDSNHQKLATIITEANFHGTFSTVQVEAVVQNPTVPRVVKATLTVIVQVINSYGGFKQANDFTVNIAGSNPSQSSFQGSSSGAVVFVDPGTFAVTVNNLAGYTQSMSGDCAGTITAQTPLVCTIIENDVPSSAILSVVATVINDNGGTLLPSDFSLSIDGTNQPSGLPRTDLSVGTHTVSYADKSGYTASSWDSGCAGGNVSLSAGASKICTIVFDDNPPPSLACADTVIMLSGGMSSIDLSNEGVAVKNLIDLYANVIPHPLIGIGSYGGLDGSHAQVPVGGRLTSVYGDNSNPGTGLYGTVNQIVTTINSSGGTNLSAAIDVANNELNSSRHISGHAKVMIFVSDGKPNLPGGNVDKADLALSSADVAKLSGTQIFSVHFGTSTGRNLVAQLASGTIPNLPHQPGSDNGVISANSQTQIDAENADGDNFFIAPDSTDMENIFTTIANIVCPAVASPPPPTRGTIVVITQVINDNGGILLAPDFTVNVSATNPSQSSFAGSELPGVIITVDPGDYSVDESSAEAYEKSFSSGCSGTIGAGSVLSCIITNNDVPPISSVPLTPPLPSNITINSWQEKPY